MYKFQYYPSTINASTPLGYVTIEQFIKANKKPKPETVELFKKIAECEASGDKEQKARLKENLFSFTPCVNVSHKRQYKDIISFTGLLVLDFDHIDNAPEFKEFLFNEYRFIYLCWLSPSKKGVKALVPFPIVQTVQDFKSYYYGISEEMEQYNGFDKSGQNCVLPLFQSYDPDMFINPFPFKWTDKGFKMNDFEATKPQPVIYTGEKKEAIIIKMINTGINKIVDNGHPQLRSVCLAIGGYVVSGYIDFSTALNQVNYCIDTNGYLKKGIPGYKKTAKEFLNLGMSKPLTL
jgi:hypothetical protein